MRRDEYVKRISEACERNKQPILDVLSDCLPKTGFVLEIASGTGQHAAHFAAAFPDVAWQPTDADPMMRESVAGWRAEAGLPNLRAPLALDVTAETWPVAAADAIVCVNMIHIAPWRAAEGLMAGAGRLLPDGGVLYLYGPFKRDGRHTAPSNERFDAMLRGQDERWGIRDLGDVEAEAARHGLRLETTVQMPANNLSVVFRKGASEG